MRAMVLAALLVAGCKNSAVVVANAHPVVPAGGLQVNAIAPVSTAIIVGTVAAAAAVSEASSPSAPMADGREVGLQDCTKPVDLTAGNLRCR